MRIHTHTLLTLIVLAFGLPLVAQSTAEVRQFVSHPDMRGASVSMQVVSLATGRVTAQIDPHRMVVPASVLKLVTTATALDLYGGGYRFETRLEARGVVDPTGVLRGALVVVGSGDPSLGSTYAPQRDFVQQVVQAVRRAGIKRVTGGLCCDASRLGSEGVSPKWSWEDMGNYYAAGVYGLNYADNTYRLTLSSGAVGTTPTIRGTEPKQSIVFDNHLRAANNRTDSAYIYGAPYSMQRTLYGTVPAHRSNFTIKGDMPNPPQTLAELLTEALQRAGVQIEGRTWSTLEQPPRTTGRTTVLLRHTSPTLAQLVAITNQHSHNLYAEALLRLVALHAHPQQATAVAGLTTLIQHWRGRGVDLLGLSMMDGSGLSPQNRLSAATLSALLCRTASSHDFVQSLPLVGRTGTVASLLQGSPLSGRLRLKSGSMGGVQCYAGYLGTSHVVVVMVNNYSGSRTALRGRIERLLEGVLL